MERKVAADEVKSRDTESAPDTFFQLEEASASRQYSQ